MNTKQLRCVLNCDERLRRIIIGIFPSDLTPRNVDTGACIINTDTHDKAGSHWLAVYKDSNTCECFDSYGQHPGVYSNDIVAYFNNKPFWYNKTVLQGENSYVCGQYSLLFLLLRVRNFSASEIIELFNPKDHIANDLLAYRYIVNTFPFCL